MAHDGGTCCLCHFDIFKICVTYMLILFIELFDKLIKHSRSTGAVENSYRYDPFGNSTGKTEAVSNPWQFASGYLDANTGLYKFGARYYDAQVGRWTQLDSKGGGYIYANNLPNMLVDPTGYCAGITGEAQTSDGTYILFLNECQTQELEGALWVGAGISAIIAIVSAALSAGAAVPFEVGFGVGAGLLTIAAGTLQIIDGLGSNQGIVIFATGNSITGVGHQ